MSTATKSEKVLAVQPIRPIGTIEKYIRKDSRDSKKGGKKEVGFDTILKEKLNNNVEQANTSEAELMLYYNNRARAISYAEFDRFHTRG
ncbi:MAG: hypothetical protein Q4G58_03820 [bacterium]|nr:hypothetical protein [bacterium]